MIRTVSNIIPAMHGGAILSLAFTAHVVDGDYRDEESWITPCPMPARAEKAASQVIEEGEAVEADIMVEKPYTQAELEAKCMELAENAGIFTMLEGRIQTRKERDAAAAAAPAAQPARVITDDEKRVIWQNKINEVIGDIILSKTKFQMGYLEREAAARAWVDSGYAGEADSWITDFADEAKMEHQAAARLIVSQADQLRAANKALEKLRMQKYRMLAVNTPDIQAAQDEFVRIINEANALAATL